MSRVSDVKELIAGRAAAELRDGDVVNLGIGIPTLIPSFLNGRRVHLHSESGLLGVGPPASPEETDLNLVDAGRQPVTVTPGASSFSSVDAFAMIRGGHIDVTVLGALQVSRRGDLASWMVPGRDVLGVGGAMDLVVGAKKVIVATTHRDSSGRSKLVPECTYPLTAENEVDVIVTELAVFDVQDGELVLRELQPGVTKDEVAAATDAPFTSAI
ncbi:3-oxoacid CoA-transferase subunit B [Streptomyces sp. NPDC091280]|uniref:3-oxoacid CoA-transferase subunit B n=1 Tax=Streptomyces sp. NPDC091280 TaxID=3365984 RepID=UPI003808E4E3